MTCKELYRKAVKDLAAGGVDSPGADALVLSEHFLGLDRAGLALHGGEIPALDRESAFCRAVEERASRRPLQYIVGSWEFMGLTLSVGEGVLIPREDTAVLAEAAAEALKPFRSAGGVLFGLDLCAGTGAVALGLCSLAPELEITCLELSEQAFPYLERNLAAYPQYRVHALRGDVLRPETAAGFSPASLDVIVSNPPYIPAGELPDLQAEVRREPALALNGGRDGLTFYRAIADLWAPLLKPGGVLAVEIGEEQAADVGSLFSACGLKHVEIKQDWSGLDRVVLARTEPA